MKSLHLLLFCCYACASTAQTPFQYFRGASASASGGAYVNENSVQSLYGNPAQYPATKGVMINLSAHNLYEIPDLTAFQFGLMYVDKKFGNFGLSFKQIGPDVYREQLFAIQYSRRIHQKVKLGIRFDYLKNRAESYQDLNAFTFDLGLVYQLLRNCELAVHLFNPIALSYSEHQALPVFMSMGIKYKMNEQIDLIAEVEKDLRSASRMKLALKYKMLQNFELSTGLTMADTPVLTAGIHYSISKYLKIDLAVNYHQYLGISSCLGIDYQLKGLKKILPSTKRD